MSKQELARKKFRAYYKKYYAENKKKISAKRRAKWKSVPSFKIKAQQRTKKIRDKLRPTMIRNKLATMRVMSTLEFAGVQHNMPRIVKDANGKEVTIYSSGDVAHYLGRSYASFLRWVLHGVIPGASVVSHKRCWFTQAFADAIKEAYQQALKLDCRGRSKDVNKLLMGLLKERKIEWQAFKKSK
jgi:hypothetical protein